MRIEKDNFVIRLIEGKVVINCHWHHGYAAGTETLSISIGRLEKLILEGKTKNTD